MAAFIRRFQRVVASLLAGTLAYQFVLAGLGVLCVVPQQGAAMSSMGQHAGATRATGQATVAFVTNAGSGGGAMPIPGAPCDRSGTPVQCVAMVACASAVLATPPVLAHIRPAMPSGVVAELVTAAPAPTFPPELPPPRA